MGSQAYKTSGWLNNGTLFVNAGVASDAAFLSDRPTIRPEGRTGVGVLDQFIIAGSHFSSNRLTAIIAKSILCIQLARKRLRPKESTHPLPPDICDYSRTGRVGAYGCHARSWRGTHAVEHRTVSVGQNSCSWCRGT
jgi:hypothetical protein